jgi:nucleoid-associated protein YgaU
LQSSDHSKQHVVRLHETLSRIAYEEYGDSSQWRVIADEPANAGLVDNPRRLLPGTRLTVPALDVFGNPKGNT